MASKRSRKVKKRQKTLQRRRQQQATSKRRLLTQIPPERADQLAMTTTGEIMQPIRLHYEVLDGEQLRATFSTLRCLDHDAPRKRWVWLYTDEAKSIPFQDKRAADNTVLGEFVFKGTEEVVLNLRSLERATQAITFFDQHLPRTVARVTEVTISNRLLSVAEASSLRSLDQYFERADVVVKDPESLLQALKGMALRVDASLTAPLCSLMRSDDYTDWLQAWELIRDHMPGSVTTFDALDAMLDLDTHDCSVNDMLYELDEELSNIGWDNLSLIAKRAELARWVYTHFPEETELNLGNFRSHEAEALWELGQREQAESLFQELIETYPNFAWGYIWWGDQYWMSNWSYEYAPDYDRAESLYRRALANPNLDNRVHVQDRLDDLYDEKKHPERREKIKQTRLKYLQRRQSLE
jgi:tetratricopeptide (TPR) repeat protein